MRQSGPSFGSVVALAALSVLDGVLTQWGVSMGWATEANPVLCWALSMGGWPAFWALKLSLLGSGLGTLAALGRRSRLAGAAVGALLVLHLGVLALHALGLWDALSVGG